MLDDAYDTDDNFDQYQKQNVMPVIPIRKNFVVKKTTKSDVREEQGLTQIEGCEMNCEHQIV